MLLVDDAAAIHQPCAVQLNSARHSPQEDRELIAALARGLKRNTNLLDPSAWRAKKSRKARNGINRVVVVVSAVDVSRGEAAWVKPLCELWTSACGKRAWIRTGPTPRTVHAGYAPALVVTHADTTWASRATLTASLPAYQVQDLYFVRNVKTSFESIHGDTTHELDRLMRVSSWALLDRVSDADTDLTPCHGRPFVIAPTGETPPRCFSFQAGKQG